MEDGLGEKTAEEVLDKAKEGEFQAAFSPCVHASIWVCLYHYGIWTAAFGPIAGGSCAVVCGYAFAYGCSQ